MPHWRKMTWVLLVWLALGVAGFAYVASVVGCEGLSDRALQDCQLGNSVLAVLGMFWIVGALVLTFMWAGTRPVRAGATALAGSACGRGAKRAPLETQAKRAPVGRAGVISALVWVALALGIWFLSSRLGIQLSSIEPLMWVAGPAALVVVGWRHRLNHPLDWVAAGAVTFVLGLVLLLFSACVVTMAVVD